MIECPSCNYQNPAGMSDCRVCGRKMHRHVKQNPSASSVYPVEYAIQRPLARPKMAIFDIDDTLFSTDVRERAARRAGLIVGDPYPSKNRKYPQGVAKFLEFFDSPERFRNDPMIPGALGFVEGLVSKGYVIAYLTARRGKRTDETIEHLKNSGFPVFETDTREPLVFLMPKKQKTTTYKQNVIRKLQQNYEVQYFFDDQLSNRQVGLDEGIIGVYDLRDRLGVKTNPNHELPPRSTEKKMIGVALSALNTVQYSTKRDRPEAQHTISTYQEAIDYWQNKHDSIRDNPALNCGCGQTPCVTYGPKPNPNTEVPEGYREAAGCLVQRKSDGKILFLRRSKLETSKHGMYEFPGGKLEGDESPMEAALIETQEEAGLEVNIIRQLSSHVDHTMKKVYHCFLAAPKKGAKVKLSFEHDMYKWHSPNKKWPKTKLSHHARFMINQLTEAKNNPGHAGPTKYKADWRDMEWVLRPGESWTQYLGMQDAWRTFFNDNGVHRSHYVKGRHPFEEGRRGANKPTYHDFTPIADRTVQLRLAQLGHEGYTEKGRNPDAVNARLDDKFEEVNVTIDRNSTYRSNPNPKTKLLPIMSGEPSGKHTKLGAVFAEVVIGRNVFKDVGEAVQGIYRGLIGGRTSMAEKRLAMGVASMQKELSDRAKQLGGNAISNLKIDYEMIQGTATISIIATADAIKMTRPPKSNPRKPLDGMEDKKMTKAKRAYKKFHGGKEPVDIQKETIDIGDVWYSLGPCWSIGYMSPKETGDEEQKYIHHVNEDSKDGNFPMMYATVPDGGEPMIVIKGGSMKIGMRDGLAWLID